MVQVVAELLLLFAFVACLWAMAAEERAAVDPRAVDYARASPMSLIMNDWPGPEPLSRRFRRLLASCVWAWAFGCGTYYAARLCFPWWGERGVHVGHLLGALVGYCAGGAAFKTYQRTHDNRIAAERREMFARCSREERGRM